MADEDLIHGRFRRVAIAGKGSFGRVLEVVDTQTEVPRALKIVPHGDFEATLLREFEQLARLRHPSLPHVFEVGRTAEPIDDIAPGAPFFVAEWIAGKRSDAIAWTSASAVWSLLADITGALATIHAAGLVHADVAPQNILVTGERAVLVDLGLAAPIDAGGARGTPAYMAPEALSGHVEPRSDLYGLGATVVRLLTERPPFEGATLGELVQRIVAGRGTPALPGIPRPLADLIGRLMHRDLDARPASALAVLDELDQLAPALDITKASARRARPNVGPPPAPASWPGATVWIDRLTVELATPQLIVIVGSLATGARQLADAGLRRRQLDEVAQGRPNVPVIAGELDAVGHQLGVATFPEPGPDAPRTWLKLVARATLTAGARVVLELGNDRRAEDMVAALGHSPPAQPILAIVDELPPSIARRRDFAILHAPVLDVAAVGSLAETMLRAKPPQAWVQALHAASDGMPLTVVELLRSIVDERDPLAVDWSTRAAAGVVELRARVLRSGSVAMQRVAIAIAVWGGRARVERVLATARVADPSIAVWFTDLVELERLGLAQRVRSTVRGEVVDEIVIDRNTLDAAIDVAGPAIRAATAAAALACQGAPVEVASSSTETPTDRGRRAAMFAAPAEDAQIYDDDLEDNADRRGPAGSKTDAGVAPPRGAARTPSKPAPPAGKPKKTAPGPWRSDEVASQLPPTQIPPIELASVFEHATLDDDNGDLACDVAEELLASGRGDRALLIARRAMEVVPARAGLIASRAAAAVGAYRDVPALAHAAVAAGADDIEAELVIARAAQRASALDEAEATLSKLHAAHPAHAEVAGTYARLLVTRSRYADARRVALADVLGPLSGLRAEAAGLAAFYLGELGDADTAFAALELGATAAADTATIGRALSLRGMVAQQRGQLGLASDRYHEAARRLHEVGELHAAAVAELNLGTVLAERGRASDALPRLAAASRVFAELGATTELIAADLNRGNALLALGQLEDARLAAEAAIARAAGAPHLRAFALLVAGDAHRRLGDEGGAITLYRDALAIGISGNDTHAQVSAHIALAEAGQRDAGDATIEALCASQDDRDRWTISRGRLALRESSRGTGSHAAIAPSWHDGSRGSGSYAALGDASRISGSHAALGGDASRISGSHAALDASRISGSHGGDASRISGSHAAVGDASRAGSHAALGGDASRTGSHAALGGGSFLALGDGSRSPNAAELSTLGRACSEVGARAADGDRLERAFRAHAVASRLASRAADHAFARSEGERARSAHAAWLSATAPAFRAAVEADPDLAALPAAPIGFGVVRDVAPPLRRLLTLSRRLNSEASVERILDEVIDTAIELSSAERGFLLLRQADGELAPMVSRNFLAAELAKGSTLTGTVSRSIAERAAQTGEPVMTVDAGVDERFGAAASVAALRLRSVLVVPLRQRGTVTGCIYVDHRLRGGAFDDAAAAVLGELADIAAIAIENARLTADLRRSTHEVAELNGRLSAELADKDAELTRVKADLPDRDRLRHRYERIVGRSTATVKMLDIVDRAAATPLPVVIVGESGTGKELVARALHDNGPRKDGPFVAINCSAVPEPLLESELFGHVRGSFTGAERDRRGLFEVADGGTLFLDEIADTSAAMQAKLLRVLQDGQVRRVGDTKTRQVDVRVIAATQHPLAELVVQGRFREDLRFRIEVIAVPVPALRDRDGDIPLLVEKLLIQLCPNRTPPRLTRAALRALGAHRWPGNIRELENALARGVAMGGDVIDVGDLPEAVANAAGRPEPTKPVIGEDLRLKPALTATEQAYISAAMSRAKGNQTAAARLLGLSRFGLQKKLRRLAGEDAADDED